MGCNLKVGIALVTVVVELPFAGTVRTVRKQHAILLPSRSLSNCPLSASSRPASYSSAGGQHAGANLPS